MNPEAPDADPTLTWFYILLAIILTGPILWVMLEAIFRDPLPPDLDEPLFRPLSMDDEP